MTDLDALLDAIYAEPDDDAPRLVYADALLERGDPRGELIVRQCRGDAARELIEQHGDHWLGELAPFAVASSFERGFLATLTLQVPAGQELAAVIGHPVLRTVRELRGPAAVAIHPSMTALRVLHALRDGSRPTPWRELLAGTPRELVELHYEPIVDEDWDPDGDVTATPQSGGRWTITTSHDELAALAECAALPRLRRLVLRGAPPSALPTVFGGTLLARVAMVETHHGPIAIRIAGGIAAITLAATASPHYAQGILELIRLLPDHLAIELTTGPRFEGRPILERALGARLRR